MPKAINTGNDYASKKARGILDDIKNAKANPAKA
jgi:hypothetical protein